MRDLLERFLRETEGAVVADYVVLSAAIVGMGLSSVNSVRHGTGNLAGRIDAALTQARVALLCTETSGSLNGLCGNSGTGNSGTGNTGTGNTGTGNTGTGPDILISDPQPDPSVDRVIDYSALRVLTADVADRYLADLQALTVVQVQDHVTALQSAFNTAVRGGDTQTVYTAIDQLQLVHVDLSARQGTDLFASQVQALYYDWVAAAQSIRTPVTPPSRR